MARELGPLVAKRVLDIGVYPANAITRGPIAERILESVPITLDVEGELISGHLASGATHAAAITFLRPALPDRTPDHYGVFALARWPLAIFNLNNDGLADTYCVPPHRVMSLHGTSLSPEDRAKLGWDALVDRLQQFPDLPAPRIPGLILPQVEPEVLASTPLFREATQSLRQARRLVIVGYSFGEGDDWLVEKMLVEAMKSSTPEVIVVSPDPEGLATRLEHLGRAPVHRVPSRWCELAGAILGSMGRHFFKSCPPGRLCARCISWLYGGAYDAIGKRPDR